MVLQRAGGRCEPVQANEPKYDPEQTMGTSGACVLARARGHPFQ